MNLNSHLRRGRATSRAVAEATESRIPDTGNSSNIAYLTDFGVEGSGDVHILNGVVTVNKGVHSPESEEDVNQNYTEVKSEEFAILSDYSFEYGDREPSYVVTRTEFDVDEQIRDKRIDDWCLSHVSYPKPSATDNLSSRVKSIAESWGIEEELPAVIYKRNASISASSARGKIMSYEAKALSRLNAAEIAQLAKFVRELLPCLLQERSSVRSRQCERKYKDIPTIFPMKISLRRCSIDARSRAPGLHVYQQMKQLLLLDTADENDDESMDDVPLSTATSSLNAESWYGWHMVPRLPESEF